MFMEFKNYCDNEEYNRLVERNRIRYLTIRHIITGVSTYFSKSFEIKNKRECSYFSLIFHSILLRTYVHCIWTTSAVLFAEYTFPLFSIAFAHHSELLNRVCLLTVQHARTHTHIHAIQTAFVSLESKSCHKRWQWSKLYECFLARLTPIVWEALLQLVLQWKRYICSLKP